MKKEKVAKHFKFGRWCVDPHGNREIFKKNEINNDPEVKTFVT
jgi:hypothetical protein